MATTKRQAKAQWHRAMKHEDTVEPIEYWGTLHISEDYDMTRFRKLLSRKSHIAFIGFIELSKRGIRPHFHFIFKNDPNKDEFRQLIKSCLRGQKFRLQIQKIRNKEAVFKYVTKSDNKYQGRSVFEINDFWHKSTTELKKPTKQEVRNNTLRMFITDELLIAYKTVGVITTKQMLQPRFLSWWKRVGRYCPKLAQQYDIAEWYTYP
ncbi:MAG: hypothetical protein WDZ51_06215 [Pirellulaceae bacterium]